MAAAEDKLDLLLAELKAIRESQMKMITTFDGLNSWIVTADPPNSPPPIAMATSATTSTNVKRIVAAFESARIRRQMERRRQRLDELFAITTVAASPAPSASSGSPPSSTTPTAPPPIATSTSPSSTTPTAPLPIATSTSTIMLSAATSSASTSIDTTTLSTTITRGPLHSSPTRCSTSGPIGDERVPAGVTAAPAPLVATLVLNSSATAVVPDTKMRCLFSGAQGRYIQASDPLLSSSVQLECVATVRLQALMVFEAASIDLFILHYDQVTMLPKPPWSLVSLDAKNQEATFTSQFTWRICLHFFVHTDSIQLRPTPWPSFDFLTVVQLEKGLSNSGHIIQFVKLLHDDIRLSHFATKSFLLVLPLPNSVPVEPLHAQVLGKTLWSPSLLDFKNLFADSAKLISVPWSLFWEYATATYWPKSISSGCVTSAAKVQLIWGCQLLWSYFTYHVLAEKWTASLSMRLIHSASQYTLLKDGYTTNDADAVYNTFNQSMVKPRIGDISREGLQLGNPMNIQFKFLCASLSGSECYLPCHMLLQYPQQQIVCTLKYLHGHCIPAGYYQSIIQCNSSALKCWKHWLTILETAMIRNLMPINDQKSWPFTIPGYWRLEFRFAVLHHLPLYSELAAGENPNLMKLFCTKICDILLRLANEEVCNTPEQEEHNMEFGIGQRELKLFQWGVHPSSLRFSPVQNYFTRFTELVLIKQYNRSVVQIFMWMVSVQVFSECVFSMELSSEHMMAVSESLALCNISLVQEMCIWASHDAIIPIRFMCLCVWLSSHVGNLLCHNFSHFQIQFRCTAIYKSNIANWLLANISMTSMGVIQSDLVLLSLAYLSFDSAYSEVLLIYFTCNKNELFKCLHIDVHDEPFIGAQIFFPGGQLECEVGRLRWLKFYNILSATSPDHFLSRKLNIQVKLYESIPDGHPDGIKKESDLMIFLLMHYNSSTASSISCVVWTPLGIV